MPKADRICALILMALGAIWIWEALRFMRVASFQEIGQNMVPLLAGIGLILGAAWLIAISMRQVPRKKSHDERVFAPAALVRVGLLLALMVLYIATISLLGFTLASALFLIAFLLAQKYCWWKSVLIAIAMAVVSLVVFQHYLAMSLPVGPWGF